MPQLRRRPAAAPRAAARGRHLHNTGEGEQGTWYARCALMRRRWCASEDHGVSSARQLIVHLQLTHGNIKRVIGGRRCRAQPHNAECGEQQLRVALHKGHCELWESHTELKAVQWGRN